MRFACGHIKTIQEASFLRVYEKFEPMQAQGLVPRWCANHFGIDPLSFESYQFWRRMDGRSIWITPDSFMLPDGVDLASVGMLVMRKPPPKGKPTSVLHQKHSRWTLATLDLPLLLYEPQKNSVKTVRMAQGP